MESSIDNQNGRAKMTMTEVIQEERRQRLAIGMRATAAVAEVIDKFRGQTVPVDVFMDQVESISEVSPAITQVAVLDILGEGEIIFSADGYLHVSDAPAPVLSDNPE